MSNPYQTPGSYDPPKPGYGAGGGGSEMQPLVDVSGWLALIGWFNIIVGGLYCLTLIGAVFGWLPLWIGFLLKNASDKLKSGQNQAAAKDLSTFFVIVGVMVIINIVILALYLAFLLLMMVVFAGAAASAG